MTSLVSRTSTVQETLSAFPDAVSAFIRLKTDCVGCWLARFCTLEDVSNAYEMPIETLLEQLHARVPSPVPKEWIE